MANNRDDGFNAAFQGQVAPGSTMKIITAAMLIDNGATALLGLRDGVIPATTGTREPAPGLRIDLVLGEPRQAELRHALVLSRGHGGFTSALVLGR